MKKKSKSAKEPVKKNVKAAPRSSRGSARSQKPTSGTSRISSARRQELFEAAYLANGMNATKAAIEAGYSPKSAASQASRLLRNVKVAEGVAEKAEAVVAKRQIDAETVIAEIAKMAFFDPRKLFDAEGKLRDIHDLDDETAAAIAGLDIRVMFDGIETVKKIKIADKGSALEKLGRYLKLFTDKVEHSFDLSSLDDDELKERLAKFGIKD